MYHSADGVSWKYDGQIMGNGSSQRILDKTKAWHPSVILKKGNPYIFYHVEPFRPDKVSGSSLEKHQRYSFIQATSLSEMIKNSNQRKM